MKTRKENRRTILVVLLVLGALLNFSVYAIVAQRLGGDALNGQAFDGHYFLGSHGGYREVSHATYTYSLLHTYAVWITHSFLFILGAVMHIRQKRKQRTGRQPFDSPGSPS